MNDFTEHYEKMEPITPEQLKQLAANLNNQISDHAELMQADQCELFAEMLCQRLQSDTCDCGHIHWITFYNMLEEKLYPKQKVNGG